MEHFWDLKAWGPPQGYFPEPTNSIFVVSPQNLAREQYFFLGVGIKIVTGSQYLGGFVGDRAAEDSWLAEKFQGWTELVKTLSGVVRKHPQSAYAGL